MKTEILQVLRSSEGYISGQELCEKFGVSRTAIWKVMNQLKEAGYEIESVPKKGYHLRETPDVMSESEIKSRLFTKWAGKTTICVEEAGSTNQELKKLAEEGARHGTLFLAQLQTAGRGRRGREWESKVGEHITMSLLLRPNFDPSIASRLTLVMAISVVKAIEELTDLPCMIKWPNDILVNGRKICGILTEMSAEQGYIHYVVIGVGVNVNTESMPEELAHIGTSLQIELGQQSKRSDLVVSIMQHFEEEYEQFSVTGDLQKAMAWYEAHLLNIGNRVRVELPDNAYEAVAIGMNAMGELLVQRDDATIESIYAGEVSIRGTKGYV